MHQTYLDNLSFDLQRRVWKECAYHQLCNPYHLLGSGSYFAQLRTATRCLILCARSDFDADPDTVKLNEQCQIGDALRIM